MTETKKLFLPLFYNTLELTDGLSNEEFGKLVRELLRSTGNKEYSASLEPKLMLAYNFMLDNAIRVFTTYTKKKAYSYNSKSKNKEYNFDPEEAFQNAIARSYRSSEQKERSTD